MQPIVTPKPPWSLVSFKSRQVLLFWYRLTQVVPKKSHKTGVAEQQQQQRSAAAAVTT